MSLFKIYLIGFILSFIVGIYRCRNDRNQVNYSEIFILSLLSWLTLFSLWVGFNLKKNNDENC